MPSRRRLARIAAMQTVFAMQAREVDPSSVLLLNCADLGGAEAVDTEFSEMLVLGIQAKGVDIRQHIEEHAPQWSWDRMDSITKAILLVAVYELLHAADVPPAVVMNEAIEIAKEFGTAESSKFVNGVLNAVAQKKKS